MSLLEDYSYLLLSVVLLAVAISLLYRSGPHRRFVLAGGFLSIPFGLFSFLYIPEYWNPPVTFHYVASPEDVFFSFATGCIVCFVAVASNRGHWNTAPRIARMLFRFVGCSAFGLVIVLSLRHLWGSTHVMHATIVAIVALGCVLIWRRSDMVHVGLLSGVVFTLFYGILLWTIHLLSPDFIDCWTPAAQLPFTTLGLPTFEFVWAFCFGFTWPMLMVYVQDASIDESDVSTVGDASR